MELKTCKDCGFKGENTREFFPTSGYSVGKQCRPCRNKSVNERLKAIRLARQPNPDKITSDDMEWLGSDAWLYM